MRRTRAIHTIGRWRHPSTASLLRQPCDSSWRERRSRRAIPNGSCIRRGARQKPEHKNAARGWVPRTASVWRLRRQHGETAWSKRSLHLSERKFPSLIGQAVVVVIINHHKGL